MSRVQNSIKNTSYAFAMQFINTLFNFIFRTVVIKTLGIQVQSLNGLFTEVLAALSLAELGVGSAIVYNLYKPLAEGNTEKVKQLMQLFKKAYRIIAGVTFTVGTLLCPFVHLIVNSVDYSRGYIQIVYMLFVIDLSISYLFSYKISLITADQKTYIFTKIDAILKIISLTAKIAVIVITRQYIAYLITCIAITLITNTIKSNIVNSQYNWLKEKCEPLPKEERDNVFSNIKNIFIKSLSGKITNSTDNILISILVSTVQVGYYTNYSLVMGVFRQIANQIAYNGVTASLGNMMAQESKDKCIRVFYRLQYLFFLIAVVSAVAIYVCINPFIVGIWRLGGEEFLLPEYILFVLCATLFIEIINRPLWAIMEVSGLFKYDKWASIVGSIVNLIVSIILGKKIGMAGIFIGTIITYLTQAIIKAYILFKLKFDVSPIRYYINFILSFIAYGVLLIAVNKLCTLVTLENSAWQFIMNGGIAVISVLTVVFLFTFRTEQFQYFCELAKSGVEKIMARKVK